MVAARLTVPLARETLHDGNESKALRAGVSMAASSSGGSVGLPSHSFPAAARAVHGVFKRQFTPFRGDSTVRSLLTDATRHSAPRPGLGDMSPSRPLPSAISPAALFAPSSCPDTRRLALRLWLDKWSDLAQDAHTSTLAPASPGFCSRDYKLDPGGRKGMR